MVLTDRSSSCNPVAIQHSGSKCDLVPPQTRHHVFPESRERYGDGHGASHAVRYGTESSCRTRQVRLGVSTVNSSPLYPPSPPRVDAVSGSIPEGAWVDFLKSARGLWIWKWKCGVEDSLKSRDESPFCPAHTHTHLIVSKCGRIDEGQSPSFDVGWIPEC